MNAHVVQQVAKAIASWLPPASEFIVGRDARHGSEDFANVTARVLAAAGHHPRVFADPVPTPVVAHEVVRSNAAGGVMVTASHNPATDNGYKVYAADGAQILLEDADRIQELMAAEPWPDSVDAEPVEGVELLGQAEVDAYLATITADSRATAGALTIAYTALHGVGGDLFVHALTAAGHEVHSVAEQHQPDPNFPTAAFPNPEEPGTLDRVIALAEDVDADLVLANDPDADRLAVAVKRGSSWERLTGDQIGVLLGASMIGQTARVFSVATTIVSSSLLAKIAALAGVRCHTTLTGFKWLARAGDDIDGPLAFAYEEALGYSVSSNIRDKDGISAGLRFAQLVAECREHGETVDHLLTDIYETHGYHLTAQVSARFEGEDSMANMTAAMRALREDPPTEIAGCRVDSVVDLVDGTEELAPSNVLIYQLEGGRVIVRPSGTEPKVKAYLEAVDADPSIAAQRLTELETAATALLA